ASPPDSELVSSEVMEIVIPEVGGIDDDILLMIEHDDLREKLRNVNLLISKIEALNANPTPSSDCKTKSSSTSLTSLLEETNTFDNSLPEFKTFSFDVKEISIGSTTTHPDLSLPEYEAFHDNHIKEFSSGSPTTHSAISLSEYDSFMFDLSTNPFPPADRSDSYELNDELIPFISAPEYDCFRFTDEPNSKDFTMDVVETISPTKEPQVLTILPTHPTLQLNLKFQPSIVPAGKKMNNSRDTVHFGGKEIEFLLSQCEDSDFKNSIDQSVLTHCDDLFVDPTPEMFTGEQPPNYSFPSRFDVYPDDFLEIESDATFDDDSFDSEGEKIKEAELLIDPLDLPYDILSEYDSFSSQDFSREDVLPSPDNEDKVKENSKKDKIESQLDKNGKRGKARKSQKQLQWIEQEKLKKTEKEGPEMQTHAKSFKF
nr:hypothetical protein [Tanacetum cinerariifolium]